MKIYLFPELTKSDKSQLNKYNLKYLGKFKSEDKDINDAVKGKQEDLEKYASDYLGYELHPLYLYTEEEFPYDMLMEDAKEVVNHGKKKWVKTKEDDKVWNSLSEDDKYFLSMSLDMGFWFDEIKGNEDLEDRYNELSSKFHIMHDDIEEINEEFNNDDYDLDSFLKDAEVILVDDAKTFDINKWEQENEEEIYEELEEDYIKEDVDKKPKFIKYKLNNDDIKKVIDNIKTKDLNIIDYWKTNQFLKKNNLQKDDLKEVIHNIEIEDYKTNSKPENKDDYNEAVIFVKNSKIKDLGPFELYIKLDYDRIEENPVIVISIHSKRNLGLSENMHNKIHLRDIIKEKLIQGKSDRTLKKNIETEIKAGKDPKQAYAIAKYIQRKKMNEYSDESLKEDKNIIDVKEKIKLIEPVYTDDDNVEYGTELWFDVVKKFNIEPLGDDEWVNLYITYNPVKGKIEEIKAFVDKSSGSEEIENVEQYFSSDELFDIEDMVDEEFQEIKDDWEEYTGKYYLSESLKEKLIQDKHMNEQLIADKYDYIKQDLNKENISYEYDEQETFKFYNYEDYRWAEEVICDIVGEDYSKNNDTLEIIVYEDELNEDINDKKYLIPQDKFDKLYYKYIKAMNYLKEDNYIDDFDIRWEEKFGQDDDIQILDIDSALKLLQEMEDFE